MFIGTALNINSAAENEWAVSGGAKSYGVSDTCASKPYAQGIPYEHMAKGLRFSGGICSLPALSCWSKIPASSTNSGFTE